MTLKIKILQRINQLKSNCSQKLFPFKAEAHQVSKPVTNSCFELLKKKIHLVVNEHEAEKEPEQNFQIWTTLKRIIKLARPEWTSIVVAAISSILVGASFPCVAIIFGEFYGVR